MNIEIHAIGLDKAEVCPGGDLLSSLAGALHDQCKKLIAAGVINIELNLEQVRMVNSVGFGLLVGLSTHCKANGGSFRIIRVNPVVKKSLQAMNLAHFIAV